VLALAAANAGFELRTFDEKYKKLRKPLADKAKAAEDQLYLGKATETDVDFLYMHDLGQVWIRRKDNGKIVERREMNEEEREEQDIFDTEEDIEVNDDEV